MSQRPTYTARVNRVVDHVDRHLAGPLDLATLAAVAHFSPWHFHRLFQALTGETVADLVRRRRVERAAGRLLARPPATVLAIALDVGFASAEVFTRAFKAHFGITPSAWRRGAWRDWARRHRIALGRIHQAQHNPDQDLDELFHDDAFVGAATPAKGAPAMKVEIRNLPARRVAYLRHTGPYGDPGIGRTWDRLLAWCGARGLLAMPREGFGISHDSPDITAPEKCRYDACVAVDDAFRPEGDIGVQTLPAGRYACMPFRGTGADIHAAWMRLYGQWLPASGWQSDDRPAVEAYGSPLDLDPETGVFGCELWLPVRPA